MESNDNIPTHDYSPAEDLSQQPTAEPRAPQLNGTICGCNCAYRGFVEGDGRPSRGGGSVDNEHTYLRGEEGIQHDQLPRENSHTVLQDEYTPFIIPTPYAEYEYGRGGIILSNIVETSDWFPGFQLQRTASQVSMVAHLDASGRASGRSSSVLSVRPESQTHLVVGTIEWADAWLNTAEPAYFFTSPPLALVAPVQPARCCTCRSGSDTEFDASGSTLSYQSGSSEWSDNAFDEDSAE